MAEILWWAYEDVSNPLPGFAILDPSGSPPTAQLMTTGWTVGKLAPPRYGLMRQMRELGSADIGTTALPSASPYAGNESVGGDSFVTLTPLSGTFAAGFFDVSIAVLALTGGGAQDGRMRVRIWHGPDRTTGTGCVEMTNGATQLSIVTNLTTSTTQLTQGTVQVSQNLTLNNEYLYVQCAWEITGAGAANGYDVKLYQGSSTFVNSTDFTVAEGGGGGGGTELDPMGMSGFFGV